MLSMYLRLSTLCNNTDRVSDFLVRMRIEHHLIRVAREVANLKPERWLKTSDFFHYSCQITLYRP